MLGADSRQDSSFIEFESHIGRAPSLAMRSITLPNMQVGPIADAFVRGGALRVGTIPTKNSTTVLGMAPAIGSWVAAKGLHAAPTPLDHGDHARLLSLRLSMHSMCRFLIHSIVGHHVLRDHQVELQSIHCELHLGGAHCRHDCMIVSFVETSL